MQENVFAELVSNDHTATAQQFNTIVFTFMGDGAARANSDESMSNGGGGRKEGGYQQDKASHCRFVTLWQVDSGVYNQNQKNKLDVYTIPQRRGWKTNAGQSK